jgi:hypothetical protein
VCGQGDGKRQNPRPVDGKRMNVRGLCRQFGLNFHLVQIIAEHQTNRRDTHGSAIAQGPAGENGPGQPTPIFLGNHCLDNSPGSLPISSGRIVVPGKRRAKCVLADAIALDKRFRHADCHLHIVGVVAGLFRPRFYDGESRPHTENHIAGQSFVRRAGCIAHCQAEQASVEAFA